jgi:hypothetical protein
LVFGVSRSETPGPPGKSPAKAGTAFAPAQGIEAEQKPAGFLLERIARFFCEAKKCAQKKLKARRFSGWELPVIPRLVFVNFSR